MISEKGVQTKACEKMHWLLKREVQKEKNGEKTQGLQKEDVKNKNLWENALIEERGGSKKSFWKNSESQVCSYILPIYHVR